MATFIEVNSFDKGCPVIVNLDTIVEIAPLVDGGCILFMNDGAGMNSRQGIRVTDDYNQFKQFAMQTVTAEDIVRRFPKVETKKETKKSANLEELEIPKL
jgi:hypothetical protein